jgi:secondary thiamine-phosphate synthase enzyme
MKNITKEVEDALKKSAAQKGICVVFCPHTTAAITINEDTDPGVQSDFLAGLGKAFPDLPEFLHAEGNSAAHLKSSAVGASETVLIEEGRLILGKWQGIYFCEFDGPRNRQFYVKIIEE